jgi:uncharacterized protein (DUF486 family)
MINPEFKSLVQFYQSFLPLWSFPWIMLTLASLAQYFAWWGGLFLFPNASLFYKILFSWLIVLIEFIILVPTIGASVQLLGYDETYLSILSKAFQLIIFYAVNTFTLHAPFTPKYILSFLLMLFSLSVIVVF